MFPFAFKHVRMPAVTKLDGLSNKANEFFTMNFEMGSWMCVLVFGIQQKFVTNFKKRTDLTKIIFGLLIQHYTKLAGIKLLFK